MLISNTNVTYFCNKRHVIDLTYLQVAMVKSIICLTSRRKKRVTKIRLFFRDNFIFKVKNAQKQLHMELLQYEISFDIFAF